MESSTLIKIPAEVRNRIYALTLHEPKGINIQPNGVDTPANKHLLALTAVCRELRADTWQMFYAVNDFTFKSSYLRGFHMDDYDTGPEYEDFPAPWSRSPIIGWFSKVGQENLVHAPQLIIELGELTVTFDDELEIDFALDQIASEVLSKLSVDSKPLQNVVLVFKVHHSNTLRTLEVKAVTMRRKDLLCTIGFVTIVDRDWDDDDLERLHDLVCDAMLQW
ncbi:hypothetical protein LTR56_006095 [Elasticomyces elasticus]|nr:hypothetical protein LTR56_006095 [Elasticomyces elasticus]KAK3667643.1 hypothetical protein LTR22_001458 [Elasticomyces elasticus]KAK4928401.1 hypothetical protein LTR49_004808 [Elasticomyces elasticus]KAK5767202.1 hypothetical protein LTS12_002660 [Elasticomyces elasticus]